MNSCNFLGRLAAEPELTHSPKDPEMAICRYTIAVDRRFAKKDAEVTADFIRITAFGKAGEFASKYFHKGQRVLVQGHLQTSKFKNKDGIDVYAFVIVAENQEFADLPKNDSPKEEENDAKAGGFIEIPEDIEDEFPYN